MKAATMTTDELDQFAIRPGAPGEVVIEHFACGGEIDSIDDEGSPLGSVLVACLGHVAVCQAVAQ